MRLDTDPLPGRRGLPTEDHLTTWVRALLKEQGQCQLGAPQRFVQRIFAKILSKLLCGRVLFTWKIFLHPRMGVTASGHLSINGRSVLRNENLRVQAREHGVVYSWEFVGILYRKSGSRL